MIRVYSADFVPDLMHGQCFSVLINITSMFFVNHLTSHYRSLRQGYHSSRGVLRCGMSECNLETSLMRLPRPTGAIELSEGNEKLHAIGDYP